MTNDLKSRLTNPRFPQPPAHSVVWRYMKLAKLECLLQTGSLYLRRLDLLQDRYEGSSPLPVVAARDEYMTAGIRPVEPSPFKAWREQQGQAIRSRTYVNCWSLNPDESDALWKLYASEDDGIAIRTTYGCLQDMLRLDRELHVGQITYISNETGSFPSDNLLYPVMHKLHAFAHEREVRFVKLLAPTSAPPDGLLVPVHVEKLIQAIYVGPYCPDAYEGEVKRMIDRTASYLTDRIQWSAMKANPHF
jgi:hypothetical protein